MTKYEHGPLIDYQITWANGHVETLKAHQVTYTGGLGFLFDGPPTEQRIAFHGEVAGRWRLVLSARVADIATVRDLSTEGLDDQPVTEGGVL